MRNAASCQKLKTAIQIGVTKVEAESQNSKCCHATNLNCKEDLLIIKYEKH